MGQFFFPIEVSVSAAGLSGFSHFFTISPFWTFRPKIAEFWAPEAKGLHPGKNRPFSVCAFFKLCPKLCPRIHNVPVACLARENTLKTPKTKKRKNRALAEVLATCASALRALAFVPFSSTLTKSPTNFGSEAKFHLDCTLWWSVGVL